MNIQKKFRQVEIHGGCMCGEVRYRATCAPIYLTMCHCSDCRRACGAQAVAWITVPDEHFTFMQGEPEQFASSPGVERTFCRTCGTSLTYNIERRKGETDITTGSLDDPEGYPPTHDYFCRDRLSWVKACTDNQKE